MIVTIRECNQRMENCIRAEQRKEVDVLTLNLGNRKDEKKAREHQNLNTNRFIITLLQNNINTIMLVNKKIVL